MEVEVLVFGQLTDITKADVLKLSGISDTKVFWERLFVEFPALKKQEFQLAVNQELVSREEIIPLNSHTRLALMPPFSGG